MNKNMALTIVAVILLGMGLVAYNEYSTPPKPPIVGITGQSDSDDQSSQNSDQANEPLFKPSTEQTIAPEIKPQPAVPAVPNAAPNVANANDVGNWSNNEPLAPKAPSPIDNPTKKEAPEAKQAIAPEIPQKTEAQAPKPAVTKDPATLALEQILASKEQEQGVAKVEEKEKEEVQQTKPKAESPKPAPTAPAAPAAPKSTAKSFSKEIKKITVSTIGDGVTVRIDSNQSPAYKAMRLNSPERIVLDLNGDWKVKAPGVPTNEFVSNVRIGEQKDGTRIVIDLKKVPASVRYLKYGSSGLDVRIR